jgi:undecaprenyl-diphosphatase
MVYLLSVILGLIQALTEFLPISSSAHLLLARAAMDFEVIDGLTFDVGLHVGTLLAIFIYFRQDIAGLISGFIASIKKPDLTNDANQRLVWFILAASIPAALVGLFLESAIESYFRNPSVVVVTLFLGGVLFLVAERVTKQERDITTLSLRGSVLIGVAQALALIPGVSRSGITIVAGLTQRLKRAEAARFSFLLGAPARGGLGCLNRRNGNRGFSRLACDPISAVFPSQTPARYFRLLPLHPGRCGRRLSPARPLRRGRALILPKISRPRSTRVVLSSPWPSP